ncbi:hypothetical protein DL770_003649 [Monosporascus sp. CRB-9-2]|nr:hypothetical protein DL770_003649 [Monosporascus sp. CRB-9-2]
MKVTAIYVYPIKALRGISVNEAQLGPQGVQHDRRFMLCRCQATKLSTVNLYGYPECALFAQEIVADEIHVRYLTPEEPLVPPEPSHGTVLRIPLNPSTSNLTTAQLDLNNSMVMAYRMGSPYDDWFSAYFGFETALMYIGDGRRPVLGTFMPQPKLRAPEGWLSALWSRVSGQPRAAPPWLVFSDVAPFLFTSEQSLRNVSARLPEGDMEMYKFRPSIVVDGEDEFDEDFWAELCVNGNPAFTLTKMCGRCSSINVDYATGRLAKDHRGTILKKLMSDRRVDAGDRYSPIFGKYGFLVDGCDSLRLRVGDEITVAKRSTERPVCDWPTETKNEGRFYQYS